MTRRTESAGETTEQVASEFMKLLSDLYHAAKDSAAFADGKPTGRSRSVSLRKLRAAVEAIDALDQRL